MVSAWACASRLVLGQEVTEEKSSEILSSRLLIRAVITYWVSKATKVRFMKQRKIFFKVASDANVKGVKYGYHEETDKNHGRIEVRRYWITEGKRLQRLAS